MNHVTVEGLIQVAEVELLRAQYMPLSIRQFTGVWSKFKTYAVERGITQFSAEVGKAFLADAYCLVDTSELSCANQVRLRAMQVLIDIYNHQRVLVRRTTKEYDFTHRFETVFSAFIEARKRKGLSMRTLESDYIYLERFAQYLLGADVGGVEDIDVTHIHGFLQLSAASYSAATVYCMSSTLRGLFRYVYDQSLTSKDFASLVPTVHYSKTSKVPSAYAADEICRLLACVDRGNPKGKRDYAIMLLAIRLGLRASDICSLTYDNFKWDRNTIELHQGKTNRPLVLPLLNDVGEAVIDYLKNGRPVFDVETVFLRLSAPIGPMRAPTLHSIVTHYVNRANIEVPLGKKHGPHALRHSLASALLNNNTPMPLISEILGHADSKTTSTYLRIDVQTLRQFTLDVPPVRPVQVGGLQA